MVKNCVNGVSTRKPCNNADEKNDDAYAKEFVVVCGAFIKDIEPCARAPAEKTVYWIKLLCILCHNWIICFITRDLFYTIAIQKYE